jgi:hypothetical protein
MDLKPNARLKRHKQNKIPCFEKKGIDCPYCGKQKFNSMDSKRKHINYYCKTKKNNHMVNKKIKEELKIIKQKMKKIEKTINNQSHNVNLNNNCNNITNSNNTINNNIKIMSFGKENLSDIMTAENLKKLPKDIKKFMPALIKMIHFDKNNPENHNLLKINKRNNEVYTYNEENEDFQLNNFNTIKDELYAPQSMSYIIISCQRIVQFHLISRQSYVMLYVDILGTMYINILMIIF